MIMTSPSTIIVDVALHQNWYVATSKSLNGLFVAHQSLGVLFQEIPEVITLLIKEKTGADVVVTEAPQPDSTNVLPVTYVAEPVAA
jgi:hypothetical protein